MAVVHSPWGPESVLHRPITIPCLLLLLPAMAWAQSVSADPGELVVEGERREDPAEASPVSVTIIDVDDSWDSSTDVATAVNTASGVVVRRLGGLGDYSTVSIRGSGAQHVQVYLDGVPLNPEGSEGVNLSELPLQAFSRIEIYRSGAPAELDAAPIGGVINLVTAEGVDRSRTSVSAGQLQTGRMTASTIQSGGSDGVPWQVLAFTELFHTRGNYAFFSDNGTPYELLDDTRATRDNNAKDQMTAHARVRIGDQWRWTLSDAWTLRHEGLPGRTTNPAPDSNLRTSRNLLTQQVDGSMGAVSLTQRTWWQHRDEVFDDRAGDLGLLSQWARYRSNALGGQLHARWAISERLVPGITATSRWDAFAGEDLLAVQPLDSRRRWTASATAMTDLWVVDGTWRVQPLVNVVHAGPASRIREGGQRTVASPQLGMTLRPAEGTVFKLRAGQSYRVPSFTELYGDRGAVQGNPELLPETSWQLDGGLRLTRGYKTLEATVDLGAFAQTVRDQVVYIQNGQGTATPINVGRARTHGVELALHSDLDGLLASQTNLTWLRAINLTPRADVEGNRLPRVPEWEVSQRTTATPIDWLQLGHSFTWTAGNYWDATNFFQSPDRSLHGAHVRVGTSALSVEATVMNLANTTVTLVDRNPLDTRDDTMSVRSVDDFMGYPLPGRTWMLTARWAPQHAKERTP